MAKINARELDPQRYSCIQTEQQELKKQYSSHIIGKQGKGQICKKVQK